TYFVLGVLLLGLLLSRALFFVTRTWQRARAEAENHRERLYDILMKAPASISIRSGDDLRFTLVNPLYQALAGPDRALLGRSTGEALGDLQSPLTGVAERVYRTGEKFEAHEMPAQLGDREVYLDAVFVPLRDERGRVDSVMSFAIDVTGQVQARRRIEEALRLRDEFLSIASHELRTPLTPLMLRLESMRRELERPPEVILGRLPNHIEVMRRQVRRLADLVDGLLDVSRIREGRLSLQPEAGVDLLEVAREVVARFQPEAARVQSPLVLEAEGPVSGTWDRLRLEQVVTNLVSNALKYGPGKPVRVRVGAVESGAVLEVSDEGIGIAPEALPRIFDRFARGVSDRHYGGLGLGLYISRQIVDAMHGSIEVHSERGKRTVFRVVLPRDPEPARPQEEGGAPVGAPPGDSPTPA
ncbi:MAG: ATP-binding protein, partial [Myxococcales bacterium]